MGALTSNRKRGDDNNNNNNYTLNYKSPFSDRLLLPDTHVSKKPKTSPHMHLTPDPPVSSSRSAISRIQRYPAQIHRFRREVHAPCRVLKFGGFAASSRLSNREKFSADIMGNVVGYHYERAKIRALDSLRYWNKDKGVTEVHEEEVTKDDYVSEDSSIEEVEVVDVDGREGRSGVSDRRWRESNGAVVDLMELDNLDGKVVGERNLFQPTSSSVVSDLTNVNLKVDSTGKMLNSLLLNRELDVLDVPLHKKLLNSAKRNDGKLSSLRFQIELNERKRAMFQSLRPVKKLEEDVVREPFVPLTKEEEAEVARAFSHANRRRVLVTHENSNIEISGEMLQCLRPGAWLNDEVINVYLELLKEREKREPQKFLKCHFFSTFFYKKLIGGRSGYDFKAVKRWTSQRKLGYCLLECDKVFVPIHKEVHWCLAVINKKDEKFQYLDSLRGVDKQVMKVLARYFVDEVKDKIGKDIDVSSWRQEYVEDLPDQENGFDCGMFMIKYADFYSRDVGLCFNQEHMPYFRLRTAKEILRLKAD